MMIFPTPFWRKPAHALFSGARLAAVAWMISGFGFTVRAQAPSPPAAGAGAARVPVVFSGGHDTDGPDRGRPVRLIAAALGVPPEVFREAFTRVHPAGPGTGGPSPEQARANKAALMSALAPYGVTNERLDEVSNYYRYVRSRGELWPTRPAAAVALVADGKVTGFLVTEPGSGYTSAPTVSVPGYDVAGASVGLTFGREFEKNGSVTGMAMPPPRSEKPSATPPPIVN